MHRPIQHVLGRLTRDTDSGDEGDIDLNEFLYLEAIQEEDSARDRRRVHAPTSNNTWKDISPMVVLLLASVAFSIVLAMIPGRQPWLFTKESLLIASEAVQSKSQSQVDPHMSPGYDRSCSIMEEFLSFEIPDCNPGAYASATSYAAGGGSLIHLMKVATQWRRNIKSITLPSTSSSESIFPNSSLAHSPR